MFAGPDTWAQFLQEMEEVIRAAKVRYARNVPGKKNVDVDKRIEKMQAEIENLREKAAGRQSSSESQNEDDTDTSEDSVNDN